MYASPRAPSVPYVSKATGTSTPAGMTVLGSNTQWGSGGGISSSDSAYNQAGAVQWTATNDLLSYASGLGFNLTNYGFQQGLVSGSQIVDDFAFSLSALTLNGGAVAIDSMSRLPTMAFESEGSFNGSAAFVPAPGAAGLALVAGVLATRRRRA
jgi:hypothetical protein